MTRPLMAQVYYIIHGATHTKYNAKHAGSLSANILITYYYTEMFSDQLPPHTLSH